MKKKKTILFLGLVCLFGLSACAGANALEESAEEVESKGSMQIEEEKSLSEEASLQDEASLPEETDQEEPKRLNTTKFDNLPEAAKQVGYSFRALEEFADNGFRFQRFDISEEKQEVNGMELEEPYPIITLHYENGLKEITMTIFPYEGEKVQSAFYKPVCEVSTVEINEIEVHLSEYTLYFVPADYEMTDEDREFAHSGKGNFSCDGVTEGESYHRSMYWVQDGIYYEMVVGVPNTPVEEIEQWVLEYMNAELQ